MMTQAPQFEHRDNGLLVRAPAKINLSLLIAGKRADGFHELETVMAKIDLRDELLIKHGQKGGIELLCRGRHWAPQGRDNLVYRAAEEVFSLCGRDHNVRLTLTKRIPAGSGLGGASSDAAATLIGLNEYLGLGLSLAQLADIAARLGSDVAFFLHGPLALCKGRGENIAEIRTHFPFTALLILPDANVSTKKVYANYRHDADLYRRLSQQIGAHLAENRVDLVARMCANMLSGSCFGLFQELGGLKDTVESLGVGSVCLSGSGSALFCLISQSGSGQIGIRPEEIASKTGCQCIVVRNNEW
ncbi:MAG: 4-(cytidine 5'-diphospho)-2-C-methyl-D-erythritol kinase [Sedimentisphaerales bacterium]|nr:4-(cytidine 5'-diphospho)-2-C-methyl-D-erythritol kinase [Sedimentisphaerales bacterium]